MKTENSFSFIQGYIFTKAVEMGIVKQSTNQR